MAFTYDQAAIVAAFNTAGYDDVNFSDIAVARRDDGRTREVIIDRGGRMKVTLSYLSGCPAEKYLDVLGRQAAVLTERHTVVTVMFMLQHPDELAEVLRVIDETL